MINNPHLFKKLDLYILTAHSHNGLDWIHSLFDNHDQILIMPGFSLMRTINKFKIDIYKLSNIKISKVFTHIFFTQPGYRIPRRKFLNSKSQKIKFEKIFLRYLDTNIEQTKIQKIFYGIHFSFAELYKIKVKRKKILIAQEHVSWHSKYYYQNFKPKSFIFVIRDFRAAIAGSLRGALHVNNLKPIFSHQFDKVLVNWLSGTNFINLTKKKKDLKIIYIKNEIFNKNLKSSMKKISNKLNIKFSKTLLNQTFLGKKWLGESSYITDGKIGTDLNKKIPHNYYNLKNVNNRYKRFLGEEKLKIIEVLTSKQLDYFGYKRIYNLSIFERIVYRMKLIFLYLNQGYFAYPKPIIYFRNFLRRIIVLIKPEFSIKLFKFY